LPEDIKKNIKILLGSGVNLGNYFIIACLCVNGCYCYTILAGCVYSNFVTFHCITVSALFLFCLFVFFWITTVLHYSYVIWAASVDERLLVW